MKPIFIFLLYCWLSLLAGNAIGQVQVKGRVFDITRQNTLESVSVLSTSGGGTVTDNRGRFTIVVSESDSIWFSYLGKPTPRFAVATIPNIQSFEVALHVNITELKQVIVMPRNYRLDSLQNRLDYAKVFQFKKPDLESLTSMNPSGGVGIDLEELIRVFQFRKNRRMENFKERLLQEETEKYIDYRFNRALILRLTQLRGPELDTFIRWYRPTLTFTQLASEYEFQAYIKRCFIRFERFKKMYGEFRKPEEE
ncbi:MAG: hypothetical protein ACKO6K_08585 [Chitinophagaceae bacterium]